MGLEYQVVDHSKNEPRKRQKGVVENAAWAWERFGVVLFVLSFECYVLCVVDKWHCALTCCHRWLP